MPVPFAVLLACQPAVESAPSVRSSDRNAGYTAKTTPETRGRLRATYDVEIKTVAGSAHAKLDCSACHGAAAHQSARSAEASCAACHTAASASHLESVHAGSPETGHPASCLDCHGAHDIYASKDPRSHTHKLKTWTTCARCHHNPELARSLGMKPSEAASHYAESIHGRALLRGGLTVAPSCSDCHLGHAIQHTSDPRSSVNARNVVDTCGHCHQGVAQTLAQSVHHGSSESMRDGRAVTCVSCHSAHSIVQPAPEYKLATDRRCGACHQAQFATHLDTYHGKAHALGGTEVAACYDCHGHHEMLAAANPASLVARDNKLSTCRKCHEHAPENFVQYLSHGDRRNPGRYPVLAFVYTAMTWLVIGTFSIFSIHALFWCGRVLVQYARQAPGSRENRARKRELNARLPGLLRIDRFCYVTLLVAVGLLVVTGIPLKFPLSGWSQQTFLLLGGASVARGLHHAGAILALLAVTIHLARLFGALWRRRAEFRDASNQLRLGRVFRVMTGSSSPLLGVGDFRAFWAHTKWFWGRGQEPVFGRFTYWEKLDYLGATLVFAVMAASGIALWLPELTTRLAPGFVLNIAQLIHSDEALIAVGSALTYHALHVLVLSRLLVPERTRRSQPPAAQSTLP